MPTLDPQSEIGHSQFEIGHSQIWNRQSCMLDSRISVLYPRPGSIDPRPGLIRPSAGIDRPSAGLSVDPRNSREAFRTIPVRTAGPRARLLHLRCGGLERRAARCRLTAEKRVFAPSGCIWQRGGRDHQHRKSRPAQVRLSIRDPRTYQRPSRLPEMYVVRLPITLRGMCRIG